MGRPPGFDRKATLRAVEHQFRRTGYAGTSLDDLTSATGLGRGSLYGAFGNKHELFLQALGEYCTRTEAEVAEMLSGPDHEALTRLREFICSGPRFVLDDEDHLGCMAGRFALEVGGQDPDATKRIREVFLKLQEAILGCVKAAQRNGDLDPTVSADATACLILTASRGFDIMAKAGLDERTLDAAASLAYESLPFVSS